MAALSFNSGQLYSKFTETIQAFPNEIWSSDVYRMPAPCNTDPVEDPFTFPGGGFLRGLVNKAFKSKLFSFSSMFRKGANNGEFFTLEISLQLESVKYYAKQCGVGLEGIKILRQPELINLPYYMVWPQERLLLYFPMHLLMQSL